MYLLRGTVLAGALWGTFVAASADEPSESCCGRPAIASSADESGGARDATFVVQKEGAEPAVEAGQAPAPAVPVVHLRSILRHSAAPISDTEADSILANATQLLQQNDGAGDVGCTVEMRRNGPVTVQNFDGTIDSAAEFNAVMQLPANIIVVQEINWCGGPGAGIIGCAPVPGDKLAIVRFDAAMEGVLWAHEFGHNKGLSHRDAANCVMRPFIGVSHRRISSTECAAFRVQAALAAPAAIMALAHAHENGEAEEELPPVEEFVKRTYFHGVPWEQASKYGPEDLAKLELMLKSPEAAPHRANIVATMALIGDERAVEPLIQYLRSGEGKLSDAEYAGKRSAVIFLGVLANKADSEAAEAALTELVRPEESQLAAALQWAPSSIAEGADVQAYRQQRLATLALLGLSLAGTEDAIRTLEAVKQETPQPLVVNGAAPVVEEALRTAREVKEKGLMEYHAHPSAPAPDSAPPEKD